MLGTYHALYAQGLSMFDSEIKFWVATISLAHGLTLALISAASYSAWGVDTSVCRPCARAAPEPEPEPADGGYEEEKHAC